MDFETMKAEQEKYNTDLEKKLYVKHSVYKDRSGIALAVSGLAVCFLAVFAFYWVGVYLPGILILATGIAMLLRGCYTWAKRKGRSKYWMFMGLLAPFGFLVMTKLEDKGKATE